MYNVITWVGEDERARAHSLAHTLAFLIGFIYLFVKAFFSGVCLSNILLKFLCVCFSRLYCYAAIKKEQERNTPLNLSHLFWFFLVCVFVRVFILNVWIPMKYIVIHIVLEFVP